MAPSMSAADHAVARRGTGPTAVGTPSLTGLQQAHVVTECSVGVLGKTFSGKILPQAPFQTFFEPANSART
jgi:hypothetical protein